MPIFYFILFPFFSSLIREHPVYACTCNSRVLWQVGREENLRFFIVVFFLCFVFYALPFGRIYIFRVKIDKYPTSTYTKSPFHKIMRTSEIVLRPTTVTLATRIPTAMARSILIFDRAKNYKRGPSTNTLKLIENISRHFL